MIKCNSNLFSPFLFWFFPLIILMVPIPAGLAPLRSSWKNGFLFLFLGFFCSWLCLETCGILVPWQGTELKPRQCKCQVLAFGPSENSPKMDLKRRLEAHECVIWLVCAESFPAPGGIPGDQTQNFPSSLHQHHKIDILMSLLSFIDEETMGEICLEWQERGSYTDFIRNANLSTGKQTWLGA